MRASLFDIWEYEIAWDVRDQAGYSAESNPDSECCAAPDFNDLLGKLGNDLEGKFSEVAFFARTCDCCVSCWSSYDEVGEGIEHELQPDVLRIMKDIGTEFEFSCYVGRIGGGFETHEAIPSHSYRVTLDIRHKDLDASVVSAKLGLEPSRVATEYDPAAGENVQVWQLVRNAADMRRRAEGLVNIIAELNKTVSKAGLAEVARMYPCTVRCDQTYRVGLIPHIYLDCPSIAFLADLGAPFIVKYVPLYK